MWPFSELVNPSSELKAVAKYAFILAAEGRWEGLIYPFPNGVVVRSALLTHKSTPIKMPTPCLPAAFTASSPFSQVRNTAQSLRVPMDPPRLVLLRFCSGG
jgi:hypothetical protein